MAGTPRRRNDLKRMKRKALKLYPHDKKARNANHLTSCSCWACGNPRKHFDQETIQERRAKSLPDEKKG